jgi:hypothetical protein
MTLGFSDALAEHQGKSVLRGVPGTIRIELEPEDTLKVIRPGMEQVNPADMTLRRGFAGNRPRREGPMRRLIAAQCEGEASQVRLAS